MIDSPTLMIISSSNLARWNLILSFLFTGLAGAQIDQKSQRYHEFLQDKPANEVLRQRFFDSWIDSSSTAELQKFLQEKTTKGTAADWQILAGFHEQLGKAAEALPVLNEGVEKFPKARGLRLARAKLTLRLLDFKTALADLEVLIQNDDANIELLKLQGTALIRGDHGEDAVRVWKKALEKDPGNDDLREDLIEIYLAEGLGEEALQLARQLVERAADPYKKTLRQLRAAGIALDLGHREAALETYRNVIAASGDGTWLEREAVSKVSALFDREDDAKGLLAFLNSLREDHPGRTSLRKVVAWQKANVGDLEEAVAMLREVIQVTPGNLANREELIGLLEQEKQWKEAAAELQALLALREEDPALWERLAKVQRESGDLEALRKSLAKFQELKADDAAGIMKTATLFADSDFPDEATRILQAGHKKFPQSSDLAKALATRLVIAEKDADAVAILQAIAQSGTREDYLSAARALSGHGFGIEAFELLLEADDFEKDPLVLTQICQLARTRGHAEKAIPAALNLVRQAASPVALQNAIQLARSTLLRSEKIPDLIEKLSALETPTPQERCLLAELFTEPGEFEKARTLLRKSHEDPANLVKFYAVHFEQNHGDLDKAISLLSALVAEPKYRKAVHLRRLAMMHRQAGDLNSALTVIDDWRQLVPGDERAWRERISLLEALDRQDEAIIEMRRLMAKFGADPDRRARLAAALHKTRDLAGAAQLYQKLYETADRQDDKLKWAKMWAQVAQARQTLDGLKAEWTRRIGRNPREVTPLLALAEVQMIERDFDGLRETLSEALRRRPGDADLLLRSATQLKQQGHIEPAIELLKEALKHDPSGEAVQTLAGLYFEIQQPDEAINLLIKNAQNDDPHEVEKTVQKLETSGWRPEAIDYLESQLPKFPGDWRLQFYQARLLSWSGEKEKALPIFRELESATGELPRLATKTTGKLTSTEFEQWQQAAQLVGSYPAQTNPFFSIAPVYFHGNFIHGVTTGSLQRILFPQSNLNLLLPPNLPKTAAQAGRMALLEGLRNSSSDEEIRDQEIDEALARTSGRGRDFILAMYRKEEFQKVVKARFVTGKAHPDDALAVLAWLPTITKEEKELWHIAFEKMARQRPQEILTHLSQAIQLIAKKDRTTWLPQIYKTIPEADRDQALSVIYHSEHQTQDFFIRGAWSSYSPLSGHQQERFQPITEISEFVRQELLERPPHSQNSQLIHQLLGSALAYQRGKNAVELLDLFKVASNQGKAQGQQMFHSGGLWMTFSQSTAAQAHKLPSLQSLVTPLDHYFRIGQNKDLTSTQETRRDELLAKLAQQDEEAVATTNFLAVLKPHFDQIKDPVIRGYGFHLTGQKEKLAKLAQVMAETDDPDHLRFAASAFFESKQFLSCVTALLKARRLTPDSQLQGTLGWQAVVVAQSLSPVEREKVALKTIVSSLRAQTQTSPNSALLEALRSLGFQKEAAEIAQSVNRRLLRQARSKKQTKPRSSSAALFKKVTIASSAGNNDEAVRLAAKSYHRSISRFKNFAFPNQMSSLTNALQQIGDAGLMKSFLAEVRPVNEAPLADHVSFGKLWSLLRLTNSQPISDAEAVATFKKILAADPNDWEAFVGLIAIAPTEFDDWDRLFQLRRMQQAPNLYQHFANFIVAQNPPAFDSYQFVIELGERLLRGDHLLQEKEKPLPPNTFYWVRNLITQFEAVDEFAEEKAKPRKLALLRKVYGAFQNHPEFCHDAFRGYQKLQSHLQISDEKLDLFANQALQKNPKIEQLISWPSSGGIVQSAALDWLMVREAKVGKLLFSEEFEKQWQADQPMRWKCFEAARKIAMAKPKECTALYQEWLRSLPPLSDPDATMKSTRSRSEQITLFTQFFTTRAPAIPAWAGDHGSLLMDETKPHNQVRVMWIDYLVQDGDRKKFEVAFDSLARHHLGPPESWPILTELAAMNSLPSSKLQQSSFLSQQLSGMRFRRPTLKVAEMIALATFERNLQQLLPQPTNEYRESLEGYFQRLQESPDELLALYPNDPKRPLTAARLLLFSETAKAMGHVPKSAVVPLTEILKKEEGLHPLVGVLLNRVLHQDRSKNEPKLVAGAVEAMEKHLPLLEEALEKWPSKTVAMIERMIPTLEVPDGETEFLKKCRAAKEAIFIEALLPSRNR